MGTDSCVWVQGSSLWLLFKDVTHGGAGESTDPQHKEIIKVVLYPRRKNTSEVKTNQLFLLLLITCHRYSLPVWLTLHERGENPLQSMLFFFFLLLLFRKFVKENCFLAEAVNGKLQLRMNF